MHFFTLALLCFILVGVHYSDAFYSEDYGVQLSFCPSECDCQGLNIDCSRRALTEVPKPLPEECRRLYLEGNNLTRLQRNDFARMPYLKLLQLQENQIGSIEPGIFDDLKSVDRIRLNHNQLRFLPDNVFSKNIQLQRIDLSFNKLMALTSKTFYGLRSLKILHLDNNEIGCIEDDALTGVKELEVLMLNSNRLSTLGSLVLDDLKRLKSLRLSENPLMCDCRISWLGQWLRSHSRLARSTRCSGPFFLQGKNVVDLSKRDFRCSGTTSNDYYDAFLQNDGTTSNCLVQPQCPFACTCLDGIVDCRNQNLTKIPEFIPENSVEIRLEQNSITEVPSGAFSKFRNLLRIDLSKNNISRIAEDAFHGLKSLNSLFLFGNEITDLPEATFKGLVNVQVLFLNANKIRCLRRGIFADFKNLNLLSMYDNQIQTLAEGIFDSMPNIQTLHLGRNPFICDCNLRWLSEYLHKRPKLETSDARCEEPKRNNRKYFAQLQPDKFKCKGTEELRTKYAAEQCLADSKCPKDCVCDGTVVDCSRQGLQALPNDVPLFATELRLNDNQIRKISRSYYFKRLPNLQKLDLRNNIISDIEDGAFEGAESLQDLLLSNNQLAKVHPKMLHGLHNLSTLLLQHNQISCISDDTFGHLKNLKILSLNDNKIRGISSGAFARSNQLSQLNLLSNPLNCNCHLRWISSWIKTNAILIGNPRCFAPEKLKDVPLDDAEEADFICTEQEEEIQCGPEGLCPSKCSCSGTTVRCSKAKLRRFPRFIPLGTTELYLDVNEIEAIPEDIPALPYLTKLDLSNNKIAILQPAAFGNFSSLEQLILSYNKLQCIQAGALKGLNSMRSLNLHGNDISSIPEDEFKSLPITHLAIGANPFYCDCKLRWLAEWIQKTNSEIGIARCSEPKSMNDKLLFSAAPNSFICTGNTEARVLAKCDACFTFPCQNGGNCFSQSNLGYRCECPPGFHGINCENKIDACFGNPCDNGATCKVLEMGRFSCHCPEGFTGARCEINIDECKSNMCQNNATCVDLINGYKCLCSTGFTDELCDRKIDYCSDEFNPCQNGAKCVPSDYDGYECICQAGWSDRNCTTNIDDCIDNMCQNGGTCVDGINGYECKCPDGYEDKFCETAPSVENLLPQTSPCQQHDCKHGVCFLPPGSNDYICKCSPGYTGKRCDQLSSINFKNSSYLEFEPLKTRPSLNITLKFATRKQNGVLLYFGDKQHLAVELFKGRIRISLNVGNYPVSTMFSYKTISDGTYHQLHFELVKKNFTMRVDEGAPRTIINEGEMDYLEINNSSLFIGGLPDNIAHDAVRHWHIWNATSLEGCIREFYINGNPPDLSTARQQNLISPGCSEFDETNQACLSHNCKHGKCVPEPDGQSYECKCRVGFSGPFCDQAPTCQKEIRRDFYYEKSCRSTKKLKLAHCVGSCGDGCCKASKTKKRSIKLACSDGSKFTKQIEIIRKCGCSRRC